MSKLPDHHIPVLRAGRRLRVCVDYKGKTRVLLWLMVGTDGSLYTGVGARLPADPRKFIPTLLAGGGVSFSWDAFEPYHPLDNRAKISFHASGVILSPMGRSIGVNLRLLSERTYLCSYLPNHPDNWRVVVNGKRGDVVLQDLLGDDCPLAIELHYQPAGKLPVLDSDPESGSFVLPIGYTEVEGHECVLLHLVFRRQTNADRWPPRWVVAYPSLKGKGEPPVVEQWFEPGRQRG
jgi:hypothetical protein